MEILVYGDLCADLIIPYGEGKKAFKKAQKGESDKVEVTLRHGGTAGNTASVLAKLGDNPHFVTDLCLDRNGVWLKESLEKEGVDMSWSINGDRTAQFCLAILDEYKERLIFPWLPPGSGFPTFSRESFKLVDRRKNYLLFTSGMVMQNNHDSMQAILDFTKEMKDNGSKLVFDLNVRAETYGLDSQRKYYYDQMIDLADILIGSGDEEFAPITQIENLEDAAISLYQPRHIIIARNSSKPVLIIDDHGKYYIECEKCENIKSTIGAGDTFNAALLHAYNLNYSIEKCVAYANHLAAYMIENDEHLAIAEDALDWLENN